MAEHAAHARHADASEKHRPVLQRHGPPAPGDGVRGIDHGQVDVLRNPVEERGAIRRRLG